MASDCALMSGLLRSEYDFGGAGVKWFLLGFLVRFSVDNECVAGVSDLSQLFGISRSQVSKSINKLVDDGWLNKNKVKRSRTGRPTYSYALSDHFVSVFGGPDEAGGCNLIRLYPIFELADDGLTMRSKSDRVYDLKSVTRLLLVVLLACADNCGVVRGMGSAILSRRAGMTEPQFKNQIKILLRDGYLHSFVRGATGHYLFGRMTNTYFLNLSKLDVGKSGCGGQTIVFDFYPGSISSAIGSLAKLMCQLNGDLKVVTAYCHMNSEARECSITVQKKAEIGSRQRLAIGAFIEELFQEVDYFTSTEKLALSSVMSIDNWLECLEKIEYLQALHVLYIEQKAIVSLLVLEIERVASDLLNKAPSLATGGCRLGVREQAAVAEVFEQLQSRIFAFRWQRENQDGESEKATPEQRWLTFFVFLLAVRISRLLGRLLERVGHKNFEDYDYAILPERCGASHRNAWVVRTIPKQHVDEGHQLYWKSVESSEGGVVKEGDMSMFNLCQVALRTGQA